MGFSAINVDFQGHSSRSDSRPQLDVRPESVRNALRQVLESSGFSRSERMKRFLRHVVETTLAGRADELKEYSIAVAVFDKPVSFDPRLDPIVRVEAGRLRSKLREYYDSPEGRRAGLQIVIRKRSYVPKFELRTPEAALNEPALPQGPAGFTEAAVQPLAVPKQATLAVLPFADLSARGDQEYFCDGITEELIHALGHVKGLHIVSRTSAMQYKGVARDVRLLGKQLNAGMVLEGSVRRSKEKVRIAVQLINARDGYHLWSEIYDRKLDDVFAVQEDISKCVARKLSGRLMGVPGGVSGSGTKDTRAYQLYLRGRYFWKKSNRVGLARAIRYFRQAISTDPGYSRAYAGLAECQVERAWLGLVEPRAGWRDARKAALKALDIDPRLGSAAAPLGVVKAVYERDWRGSEQHFLRGIELDPRHPTTSRWYALFCLAPQGRTEEALLLMARARQLDPASTAVAAHLARILYFDRRYEEAVEQYQIAARLDAFSCLSYYYLGFALERQGRLGLAMSAFERALRLSDEEPAFLSAVGYCHARMGRNQKALEVLADLDRLAGKRYVSPAYQATVHLGLSNREAALSALERACKSRCARLIHLQVDPIFDPLKIDARFLKLLDKLALAPNQLTAGA